MIAHIVLIAVLSQFDGKAMIKGQPGSLIPNTETLPNPIFRVEMPVVNHYVSGDPAVFNGAANDRSSSAFYVGDGGVWTAAPAGYTRVESDGVLIEGGATNLLLASDGSGAAWTTPAGVSRIVADPLCPMSPIAARKMTSITTDPGYDAGLQQSGTWGADATFSVFLATQSGTAVKSFMVWCVSGPVDACTCWPPGTSTCSTVGGQCNAKFTAGTTPTRVAVYVDCPVSGQPVQTVIVHGGEKGVSVGTVCMDGAMLQSGPVVSTYVESAGTSGVRQADTSYIATSPLLATMPKWCVRATVKPYGGTAWSAFNRALWSVGANATANSAKLVANTAGQLVFSHYDGTGTVKALTGTHGWPAPPVPIGGGIVADAANITGTLSYAANGSTISGTVSGAGSGTWSADPANFYFGSLSVAGSELNGYMKNFYVYAAECP